MKHFLRDCIVYCISVSGIALVYRRIVRRKGPLVRIVAFHDVENKEWFTSVMQMLTANFHIITPQQFYTKEFDAKKINILLTFDDGYQSWVDVCLPALKAHGCTGLFFINSGILDSALDQSEVSVYMKEKLYLIPKAPLTWEGARALIASGHTLGGHSINHHNLATLDQGTLEIEIYNDKQRIEHELRVQLVDFAYPFGRTENYNDNVFGVVKQAGYTWQYSAMSSFVTNTVVIPRMLIEKNQPLKSLKRWIEGGYDIFTH